VNRELERKARALAGWKSYITNITNPTPEFVISAYHQLWRIEKSFRMSKHDLKARPIYHHKRESIEAHLTVVFAALAVTRLIEANTGWSIKKFVQTARRYRTIAIRAGAHVLTAEEPLPPELRDALAVITGPCGAHQPEPSRVRRRGAAAHDHRRDPGERRGTRPRTRHAGERRPPQAAPAQGTARPWPIAAGLVVGRRAVTRRVLGWLRWLTRRAARADVIAEAELVCVLAGGES
jgi:hypothetical protein